MRYAARLAPRQAFFEGLEKGGTARICRSFRRPASLLDPIPRVVSMSAQYHAAALRCMWRVLEYSRG